MEEHYLLVHTLYDEPGDHHTFFFHAPKAAFAADPIAAAVLDDMHAWRHEGHQARPEHSEKHFLFAGGLRIMKAVHGANYHHHDLENVNPRLGDLKLAHEKSGVWLDAGMDRCVLPPGVAVVKVFTFWLLEEE